MPVLEVTGLPQPDGVDVAGALAAVCTELAALLGEDASGTWATWRTLEAYVEGADGPAVQPRSTHPPLARLIAFEGKPPERVREVLACAGEVLARELRLEPGNVFVLYEEPRAGRLFTGGKVVG